MQYIFEGVFEVVPKAGRKHGKRSFRIVDWYWLGIFAAPCPMRR